MDQVKKAVSDLVQEAVRKALETELADAISDLYDEEVSFEFQKVTDLNLRIRINQGPYKGPRYFDVHLREHF
jgi:hypothetical protein